MAQCNGCFKANGAPAYITKRFDYNNKGEKLSQEDFSSILQANHKYKSKTYQDVGEFLSLLNRVEFLRVLVFNFLTDNGDVH